MASRGTIPDDLRAFIVEDMRRRVEVRNAVQAALVQEGSPTSDDLAERILHLPFADAAEVLRHHAGYQLAELLRSYRLSIDIFDRATSDLLVVIDEFQRSVRSGEFDRWGMSAVQSLEHRVQKELFASTAAAHSAVDHARRLQLSVKAPDYNAWHQTVFGSDGMHEFIIWLRTVLHHVHVVEPGWQTRIKFGEAPADATFVIARRDLIARLTESNRLPARQRSSIDTFLRATGDDIDLRRLFNAYRQRVRDFSTRLLMYVEEHAMEDVDDLERLRRESRNLGTRLSWAALIGNWVNWERPPNPYDHLARFMSEEQLAHVNAFKRGSPEQIDCIIQVLDEQEACDARLRELIHRYFAKAIAVHVASTEPTLGATPTT